MEIRGFKGRGGVWTHRKLQRGQSIADCKNCFGAAPTLAESTISLARHRTVVAREEERPEGAQGPGAAGALVRNVKLRVQGMEIRISADHNSLTRKGGKLVQKRSDGPT